MATSNSIFDKQGAALIPTRIGQIVNGCMFVGINRIQTRSYAIFVSPANTVIRASQKTSLTHTPNTQSVVDGYSNTQSMFDLDHPAAYYCATLSVNGFGDFYLPSMNELNLCFNALNPGSRVDYHKDKNMNVLQLRIENNSSIPVGSSYTLLNPLPTEMIVNSEFKFNPRWYWSSTEVSTHNNGSLIRHFFNGLQNRSIKTSVRYSVRAVRRQLIEEIL